MEEFMMKMSDSAKGTGHYDISKCSMEEKLKLIEALIRNLGEGNTYLVVTSKDEAKNMMIAADTVGADVMA